MKKLICYLILFLFSNPFFLLTACQDSFPETEHTLFFVSAIEQKGLSQEVLLKENLTKMDQTLLIQNQSILENSQSFLKEHSWQEIPSSGSDCARIILQEGRTPQYWDIERRLENNVVTLDFEESIPSDELLFYLQDLYSLNIIIDSSIYEEDFSDWEYSVVEIKLKSAINIILQLNGWEKRIDDDGYLIISKKNDEE